MDNLNPSNPHFPVTNAALWETERRLAEMVGSLREVVEQVKSESPSVKFYSIPMLEGILGHSRNTITGWIETGKKDRSGNVVKLTAYKFAPGMYRVELQDLLAFGKVHDLTINLKPLKSPKQKVA